MRDGEGGTREVSEGTLELRVIDLGEKRPCDNMSKQGEKHPDTQYIAGRISSKNRQELVKVRWTARLRVPDSGQAGMFPEPLFAILNFAKLNDSPMTQPWGMQVDWVKHERRADLGPQAPPPGEPSAR